MDTKVACTWMRDLCPHLNALDAARVQDEGDEWVLFVDSLHAQTTEEFKKIGREGANILTYHTCLGMTDWGQPIDNGYGLRVRKEVGRLQDQWLQSEDHLEKWESGLTASERRVLMTHWVGDAVQKVNTDRAFIRKCFQHTGCELAVDHSMDSLIKVEGLSAGINYMRDRPEPPKEVYRPPTPPPPAGEDEAEAEVIEREEERLAAEEEEQLLDEVLVPDEELADEDDDGADVIEPGRLTAEEETELIAAKAAASVLLDGPEAVLPPRQARASIRLALSALRQFT